MRVASFLNKGDLEAIKKTYDLLSEGFYVHASPTLFNGASKRSQLSSCFLIGTDDSMDDITDTMKSVCSISKWGGGIGLHVSNIRAKGSLIRGTNGPSSGLIPMLQVYNSLARYVNQGGKRKGSIAIYLLTSTKLLNSISKSPLFAPQSTIKSLKPNFMFPKQYELCITLPLNFIPSL